MGVAGAAAQTVTPGKIPATTNVQKKDSEIRILVTDVTGAVIPGAHIRMLDKSGSEKIVGTTD